MSHLPCLLQIVKSNVTKSTVPKLNVNFSGLKSGRQDSSHILLDNEELVVILAHLFVHTLLIWQ